MLVPQRKRQAGTALLKAGEYAKAAAEFAGAVESLSALHSLMLASPEADTARLPEVTAPLLSSLLNESQSVPARLELC